MKKLLLVFVLVIIAFALYWYYFRSGKRHDSGPKMTPIALKKHSDNFNNSINRVVNAYLEMKDAFVEADTTGVKTHAKAFISLLDSIPVDELKNDTAIIYATVVSNIADIKSNAISLNVQTDITEMRRDFSMVTEMMYPSFFKAINYEGPELYLQNCPMAFGEEQPANWISNSNEVVNPYLGKNHPEHKDKMLHCGSVKDSLITKK